MTFCKGLPSGCGVLDTARLPLDEPKCEKATGFAPAFQQNMDDLGAAVGKGTICVTFVKVAFFVPQESITATCVPIECNAKSRTVKLKFQPKHIPADQHWCHVECTEGTPSVRFRVTAASLRIMGYRGVLPFDKVLYIRFVGESNKLKNFRNAGCMGDSQDPYTIICPDYKAVCGSPPSPPPPPSNTSGGPTTSGGDSETATGPGPGPGPGPASTTDLPTTSSSGMMPWSSLETPFLLAFFVMLG